MQLVLRLQRQSVPCNRLRRTEVDETQTETNPVTTALGSLGLSGWQQAWFCR
jgi:hypothetical protein